jgi:hypothetical protein
MSETSPLNAAHSHAMECLSILDELVFSLDPERHQQCKGRYWVPEDDVKRLWSLRELFDTWILGDEPHPAILSTIQPAPVERFGIVAMSFHHLVSDLIAAILWRVSEVAHPGCTENLSSVCSTWKDVPIPEYNELATASWDNISDAVRMEPEDDGQSNPLTGQDLDLFRAALEMEYARARDLAVVNPPPPEPRATHSPDFRSVNWFGTEHSFTPNQATVVAALWKSWEKHAPDVGDEYLLELADSNSGRLDLVFRNHAAWGTMIVPGGTRGTRRLVEPKS